MISPYRHTPSARPTKISDLPSALESSLIAPRAALAALATAIPPPTQERPVESAAARYPNPVAFDAVLPAASAACTRISRKEHDSRDQDSTKEEKYIRADGSFITLLRPLSDQEISEWNYNAK